MGAIGLMKVSVITVSYNSAETIEKTIRSVIGQDYSDIEYIIIDGASTDGTVDIIRKYENNISYWVSEPDNGIYDAMNKGIAHATGEIIGIINSDDWYEEGAVGKMAAFFEQTDSQVVYGKVRLYDENLDCIGESKYKVLNEIWHQMVILHPSVFIRKSAYKLYGGFDTRYKIAADYDLMLRLYSANVSFAYLDEIIANFRKGGLSTTNIIETAEETKKIALNHIERCPERETMEPKIYDDYKWKIAKNVLENYPEKLPSLLQEQLINWQGKCVVFGMGIWGTNCYDLMEKAGITVDFFVDNNLAKWGQKYHGIEIVSPEVLKENTWNVVIATRQYIQEIKEQLEGMENQCLDYISLEEIVDRVYKEWEDE